MQIIQTISAAAIPAMIFAIIAFGLIRRVGVYDCFIDGAGEGLTSTVRILPPILGLLVASAMLRASGAMDILAFILSPLTRLIGMDSELVPLALLRPMSGGGSIGLLTDIVGRFGPDSLIGRTACVLMGSAETTFYTITVYFGVVGVKDIRHTLSAALCADIVCIVVSVTVCRMMFG